MRKHFTRRKDKSIVQLLLVEKFQKEKKKMWRRKIRTVFLRAKERHKSLSSKD